MPDPLRPHGLQHTRLPCPSLSSGLCSNSCPWSQWCHPTISYSAAPFSSCPQSFLKSESFPMSRLFAWGGQSTGASASASVLQWISHCGGCNFNNSSPYMLFPTLPWALCLHSGDWWGLGNTPPELGLPDVACFPRHGLSEPLCRYLSNGHNPCLPLWDEFVKSCWITYREGLGHL